MEPVAERERPGAAGDPPVDSVSHDPQQQAQSVPVGKLRKSALRFFAGRKSICMLPSFFGGRAKNQGRGSNKGGVTKSQTYDGAGGACWEPGDDVTASEFEFHNPNGAQEGVGKSQSLPRQKRGLRGLFSSIRRRRGKNSQPEKIESFEMSSGEIAPVVVSQHFDSIVAVRPPEAGETPTPPDKITSEKGSTVQEEDDATGVEELEEEDEEKRKSALVIYRQPLCADSEMSRLADLQADLPATSASSDNLVFGDVSSLKSFDSLTGCGDIIADQDDVSIAESSVSAERGSRNAGKRSSCLVTYQGGGEEMATPDEVDSEYLSSLWESESSEVCYLPSEQTVSPDLVTSSGNASTSPLGVSDTVLTPTDLLSPQSDRQGSVPNSDEGYYESTTPGADEDTRERPQQERLPRDSYSGDALYELFEPDDRLLSPSPNHSGDLLYALTSVALETGAMETEEERLSKIQHALLCCELQNLRNSSKDQLLYRGERFYDDGKTHGGEPKSTVKALEDAPGADSRSSKTPSPAREDCGDASDTCSFPPTRGRTQSQEELMVCFSQALVDFTKNSRRYRNSTESLDCSEASSPFGPSLNALPAIVTFDVVDMENEGESEQPEIPDEQESPYEPFEDDDDGGCYLQQDAFAECDHRTFDAYEQSLLLGDACAWGIASLPRHLSLGRPCPPVPAPLSLNRRSRSLDTDSLEFQSELYAPGVSRRWKERVETAARPSHLPLQAAYHNAEGDRALEERSDLYPCSYPPAGTKQKSGPIGVKHGMRHHQTHTEGLTRDAALRK